MQTSHCQREHSLQHLIHSLCCAFYEFGLCNLLKMQLRSSLTLLKTFHRLLTILEIRTFPLQGLALCVSDISWVRILSSLLFTRLDPLVQMSGPPRSSSNKAHLKAANSTFLFQFSFKKSFRAEPNLYISCLLNVSFFPHDKSLPHNFIPYEHMVSTQHKSVEF